MPKNKKTTRAKQKIRQNAAPDQPAKRDTLKLLRNGAIGAVALGGVGLVSVRAVRATVREHDLTIIGQGIPTIVQVHDPQCSLCTELQRETRRALRDFDDGEVAYRIASVRTDEGAAFARRHGLPHVKLMLINGDGTVVDVLEGVRDADELRARFDRFIRAGGSTS